MLFAPRSWPVLTAACLALSVAGLATPGAAQPVLRPTTSAPIAQPTPGQLSAARDLIEVTGTLSTVDDMVPAFTDEVRKQVVTRPDLTKDLDDVLKSLGPELEAQRAAIKDKVAATYAKYLTEAEMRDVVAFFKTPSGSKYIKAQPGLIDEVVNEVSNWADQTSEYVLTRARAEMSKRGHQMQ